jgi:tight adherence protein B
MADWIAGLALAVAIGLPRPRAPGRRLATLAHTAAGDSDPAIAVAAMVTALALGGVLAAARLPLMAVGVLIGSTCVASHVRRSKRAARAGVEGAAATVEVTVALAGELRAGRTPAQALAAVALVAGPLRPALEAAGLAVSVGADPAGEIARAASLPGAERLRYVAAAWSVAESAGGRVAVVLERLSEAMDGDDELRRELDSAMSGPRATMVLLAALPLLGLALGQSVGADPLQLLVHRPLGWGLLVAAAALDGLGVAITQLIARAALRA